MHSESLEHPLQSIMVDPFTLEEPEHRESTRNISFNDGDAFLTRLR